MYSQIEESSRFGSNYSRISEVMPTMHLGVISYGTFLGVINSIAARGLWSLNQYLYSHRGVQIHVLFEQCPFGERSRLNFVYVADLVPQFRLRLLLDQSTFQAVGKYAKRDVRNR